MENELESDLIASINAYSEQYMFERKHITVLDPVTAKWYVIISDIKDLYLFVDNDRGYLFSTTMLEALLRVEWYRQRKDREYGRPITIEGWSDDFIEECLEFGVVKNANTLLKRENDDIVLCKMNPITHKVLSEKRGKSLREVAHQYDFKYFEWCAYIQKRESK